MRGSRKIPLVNYPRWIPFLVNPHWVNSQPENLHLIKFPPDESPLDKFPPGAFPPGHFLRHELHPRKFLPGKKGGN